MGFVDEQGWISRGDNEPKILKLGSKSFKPGPKGPVSGHIRTCGAYRHIQVVLG
jgi:hypothetical protein